MKKLYHYCYMTTIFLAIGSCSSGDFIGPLVEQANPTDEQNNLDSLDSVTIVIIDDNQPADDGVASPDLNYEVIVANEGSVFSGIYPSCLAIKQALPNAPDGIYPIRIITENSNYSDYLVACDMTTDLGGWTMILNYVRSANQNPPLTIRNDSFPLLKNSVLGDSEALSIYWGHIDNNLAQVLNGQELRFYCSTNEHDRLMHFKTTSNNCLRYARSGQGNCNNLSQNFVPLEGHNSFLPRAQENRGGNQGLLALTAQTFQGSFGVPLFWNIGERAGAGSWDCDNDTKNANFQTIHRVWLR